MNPRDDSIRDYRYDRRRNPKEVLDYLYSRDDLWRIFGTILVTTHVIDLNGQSYVGRARVSKEDLADRHYVLYWDLSGELGILWLDEVMLHSTDPRGDSSRANPTGISSVAHVSALTVTERELLKKRMVVHRVSTHPKWADPVHVITAAGTHDIPPPGSVGTCVVEMTIAFANPPLTQGKSSS